MSRSEFGRGYATCLFEFANHAARLDENVGIYRDMARRHPEDGLFDETSAVELWANGASDHLYELIRPRRDVPRAEWQRARRLADRALDIGHGFRPSSKATVAEARALLAEAQALLAALGSRHSAVGSLDDCLATDTALGLRPQRGDWACPENLDRRDQAAGREGR